MNDISNLLEWINTDKIKRPTVIAGPCSAETREQTLEAAHQLKSHGINIFRAGIWKPRTRPNCFEGVGKKGLAWLQEAKQETGIMLATEVANTKHVELALSAGVDILWIGTRTTVNPFAVQEIANAIRNIDIPIMVKNPINPDLGLWIGAFERLYSAGIKKLTAIHRGFSTYKRIKYRNEPQWQICIDLKRNIPNLPIFCDPSHISGKRDYLEEISQTAMDLNYDGLMIEAHPDPDNAWSDAKQQLTPAALADMLSKLVIRKEELTNITHKDILNNLRGSIDSIDNQLLELLKERMNIVEKIGEYKKSNNIAVLQNQRWNSILTRTQKLGETKGLSHNFINKLFKAIHIESINHQEKVMNKT